MTLNLWCEEDERLARHRIAGQLAAVLNVDVLLVQEVATDALSETLEPLLETSGLRLAALSSVEVPPVPGGPLHTAILTRLPALCGDSIRYTVPEGPYEQFAAAASVRTPAGRDLLVVSAHLAWGGCNEHMRLRQAAALDDVISRRLGQPHTPAVLGGDFNTLPHTATLRFLTGLDPFEGRGTQWADAFALSGVGSGVSSSAMNPWAQVTASRHGFLDVTALPDRRIDFLMVRGYPYGRPFAPLRAFSVPTDLVHHLLEDAAFPPSDHDPVVVDLWDPVTVTS
jgi:endonuclease/exonuclease/phosphatase family metal-dependent hydrolase